MTYNSNYTEEDYNRVMQLRKNGFGVKKIHNFLLKENKFITKGAISRWIYRNAKPFQQVIVKNIKGGYQNLNESKAYLLGVLCGDGWVTTDYRIGLNVTDLDFIGEFRKCIFEVYGVNCKIYKEEERKTKFKNIKDIYRMTLCSKKAWNDITSYDNFKTKTWIVPKEILNSNNLRVKVAFIRGIFDSEGTIRLRRNGYAELSVCSGNRNSLLIIKDFLLKDFNIDMKSKFDDGKFLVLYTSKFVNIKNFADKIGFVIKRKQDRLIYSLSPYKRTNLKHYNEEFKQKVFELLKQGYGKREIGRILNFSHTNIYDFIEQKNRIKF